MIDRKETSVLCIGSAVFLLLSLALYCVAQTHCDIDSKAYTQRALAMYHQHSFALEPGEPLPCYAMGYSLFLSSLYMVWGFSLDVVLWMQIMLALFCGFVLFGITRKLFGSRIALLAFILFCVNVGVVTFAQFLLTETLLVTFLVLFFLFFSLFLSEAFLWNLIWAGLFLGCSIIIKPAALLYILCLFPLLLFFKQDVSWRKRCAWCILLIMSVYAPVGCYMASNKVTFGEFSLPSLGKVNLYFWFFPNVLAHLHGTTSDDERLELQKMNGDYSSFDWVQQYFNDSLRRYPLAFFLVWMKNVVKTQLGLFTSNLRLLVDAHIHGGDVSFFKCSGNVWQKIKAYLDGGTSCWWLFYVATAEALWTLLRWIFVIFSLGTLFWERRLAFFYFIVSYVGYFALITGHDGCARFRMMFEFVLVILAAHGIIKAYDFLSGRIDHE